MKLYQIAKITIFAPVTDNFKSFSIVSHYLDF